MSILSLGKQSLIYGFGHILSRLLTFFLLPLLTHSLQPGDYGMVAKSQFSDKAAAKGSEN